MPPTLDNARVLLIPCDTCFGSPVIGLVLGHAICRGCFGKTQTFWLGHTAESHERERIRTLPARAERLLAALKKGETAMGITTDRHDGCLHEIGPDGMQKCYLVLPDGQRKDLKQPFRKTYKHRTCGTTTTMGDAIAETYAADPRFYGATFCVNCKNHFPVGALGEFVWTDGTLVGTFGTRPEEVTDANTD